MSKEPSTNQAPEPRDVRGDVRLHSMGTSGPCRGCRRWRRAAILVLCLFALGPILTFVFREPLMRWAARAWVVDETPVVSDVIVVLAGSIETRPHAAAKLWHAGMAPTVLMTDIPAREGLETPGIDYASGTLMMNGVPREAIVIHRTGVTSTVDEANAVVAWCKAKDARRVLVVTDPLHTRRVQWIFRRVFNGSAIEVRVVASEPIAYELDRWWQSEFALVEFNNEILKYFYYHLNY